MLDTIRETCIHLVTHFNDFWLLASLTDSSYEEGGTKWFRRAVESYERVGVRAEIINTLRNGINGNLKALLETASLSVQPRKQPAMCNSKDRIDLILQRMEGGPTVFVEVKRLFDCTIDRYYSDVASDWTKLQKYIACGIESYQVVFFTQLPSFRYPGGVWYPPANKRWKAREVTWLTIEAQFAHLMTLMPHCPTWPNGASGPFTHDLDFPTNNVTERHLLRRYDDIFVPDDAWTFNSTEQLRDAKVGVAIWKVFARPPVGRGGGVARRENS
jgi:hypothetical protein